MRALSFIIFICLALFSCEKENHPKSFSPFYKAQINGQHKSLDACGTSALVCEFLRDTAMFCGFKCGGEGAGFYLKGSISDGTYQLSNYHPAWYFYGSKSYTTNQSYRGTLKIKKGVSNMYGPIPMVEGEFSFKAIDTATGNIVTVVNGRFLMERYDE